MMKRRYILAGLASMPLATPLWAVTGHPPLRFVQLTDTHFGQHNHLELTAQLIEQINHLPMNIDFAIHTGDIMNDSILNETALAKALNVMSKLRMPVYYVPGNHDILPQNQLITRAAYEKNFFPMIGINPCPGLAVITLYTEPLARGFDLSGFDPLSELDKALTSLHGKPTILCHHTPCMQNFYLNQEHPGWPDQQKKKWINLLNQHKVLAVLAGHFHRDEMYWLDKVPLHIAPPVSKLWERQPAYRIFTFENGRLIYRTQYLA
jgi:Icc protein